MRTCDNCQKESVFVHFIHERTFYYEVKRESYRYLFLCNDCYSTVPLSKVSKEKSVAKIFKNKN